MDRTGESPIVADRPGAGRPPVWAPEVSARFTRAFFCAVDAALGPEGVTELLRPFGVERPELEDETGWLSLDFCERLLAAAVERTGDTKLPVEVGRIGLSPRSLGFLYPLLRAFGSPQLTYRKVVEGLHLLNKVGRMRLLEIGPGHCRLEYLVCDGAPRERQRHMCTLRGAQLAAVPTIFGLPEARLVEHECQVRGDERCLYEFRWLPVSSAVGLLGGIAVGLLGAAAAVAYVPAVASLLIPTTVLCAVAGGALGALLDARRRRMRRDRYLEEQNTALVASAEATERRFAEVLEAKREVDEKVEQRTAELHEALDKLRELDRAKSEFFANVSHELRTPLTLILAPLEAMLADPSQRTAEDLSLMHRNTVRLLHLINQILDLAKVDAGAMRIRPEPTDLAALICDIARPFESLARERGIELRVVLTPPAPTVPVDPERIDVAISNLLANGLRFTPAGGEVVVRIRADARDAIVEVVDSGPGIPPEEHAQVFERFAQASQGTRRAGGTGIGLALVREIAELHGGAIHLRDQAGAGAHFVLRLPLGVDRIPAASIERRQVAVPVRLGRRREDADPWTSLGASAGVLADLNAVDPAGAPSADTETSTRAPADGPRVLVVEDHDELRRFMIRSLEAKYRVTAVSDGERALRVIAAMPPDLVVSDVMMPGIDGYELCRRLKAEVATRPIPVILVTAKTGVDRVLEGFAAGADDYLAKPFNSRELLARVGVHLRVRLLIREIAQRDKLALLGTVAAGVAHEIRNPLSVIQGVLPRLGEKLRRSDELGSSTAEALTVADDAIGRIAAVAQDLLDLSAVDREETRSWDPREGIEATLRLLRARPGSVPVVTYRPGPAATIEARPGELNQVLLNVLDNAFRAAGKGSVEVATALEDGHYVVEVRDDGPGIPRDVLSRIFDPFFTTRAPGMGTGLGLAIAEKIVTEHMGNLDVTCPPNGGTRVRIRLPLEPDAVHSSPGPA